MLRRLFFAALAVFNLLSPTSLLSQTDVGADLSGKWSGYATAGTSQIDYQWETNHIGSTVSGNISLKFPSDINWSTYAFEGQFSNGVLSFRGTHWLAKGGQNFCLATGTLILRSEATGSVLEGNWAPNPVSGGCPIGSGGAVQIFKTKQANASPTTSDLVEGNGNFPAAKNNGTGSDQPQANASNTSPTATVKAITIEPSALSKQEIALLQEMLSARGNYSGPADGVSSGQTLLAAKVYLAQNNLPSGNVDLLQSALEHLSQSNASASQETNVADDSSDKPGIQKEPNWLYLTLHDSLVSSFQKPPYPEDQRFCVIEGWTPENSGVYELAKDWKGMILPNAPNNPNALSVILSSVDLASDGECDFVAVPWYAPEIRKHIQDRIEASGVTEITGLTTLQVGSSGDIGTTDESIASEQTNQVESVASSANPTWRYFAYEHLIRVNPNLFNPLDGMHGRKVCSFGDLNILNSGFPRAAPNWYIFPYTAPASLQDATAVIQDVVRASARSTCLIQSHEAAMRSMNWCSVS